MLATATTLNNSMNCTNHKCQITCRRSSENIRSDVVESIPIPEKTIQVQEQSTINNRLNESDTIREARRRNLAKWPHTTPSQEAMIKAGWFACHVHDRTICIYCNTICHGWKRHDDPQEVHARLAPNCPFVRNMSVSSRTVKVINETSTEKSEAHQPKMAEPTRRQATFSNQSWKITSPSVDDLVRAGFYFTGVENIVTCFYCNGSLHKWSENDNPMIAHARWFPNCLYAKHLCGDDLHERIQMSKTRSTTEEKIESKDLIRQVSARLDLPFVAVLRKQYSIAVIKRCIEDQLRINNDDFVSDMDWSIACLILQKQIDVIQGDQNKILKPSEQQQNTSESHPKQSLGECFVCLTEEKQLACMPCGHLCACVTCGYALRSCPVCRETIQSFFRINSS